MPVEDVLKQMKDISGACRFASNFPPFGALALEADALDALIAKPETVQRIYTLVETGITYSQAVITFLRENNLTETIHWLTTWAPRLKTGE